MNQSHRIYFLDHLRAFVIALVVVLHGAMLSIFLSGVFSSLVLTKVPILRKVFAG